MINLFKKLMVIVAFSALSSTSFAYVKTLTTNFGYSGVCNSSDTVISCESAIDYWNPTWKWLDQSSNTLYFLTFKNNNTVDFVGNGVLVGNFPVAVANGSFSKDDDPLSTYKYVDINVVINGSAAVKLHYSQATTWGGFKLLLACVT